MTTQHLQGNSNYKIKSGLPGKSSGGLSTGEQVSTVLSIKSSGSGKLSFKKADEDIPKLMQVEIDHLNQSITIKKMN